MPTNSEPSLTPREISFQLAAKKVMTLRPIRMAPRMDSPTTRDCRLRDAS